MREFRDRHEAGERLALELQGYAERSDAVILALPRGGVVIGYELAIRLGLPLDVFVVRKLGVPGHSELAMGAIASGGVLVVDRSLTSALNISSSAFDAVLAAERAELERRERLFRGNRPPLDVHDKTVLVVDDGLATGATMRAAVEGLRRRGPAEILVAVPVASLEICQAFRSLVDDVVCPVKPRQLFAIGLWYRDFSQTTDAEARELLDAAARELDDTRLAPHPSSGAHP
ncbi:MAG: phosphoribosyltransferase [Deltaproteobacteria bacterium]|nr:phosphoribosyltransferase [Deltaproteobacteria bacterium]